MPPFRGRFSVLQPTRRFIIQKYNLSCVSQSSKSITTVFRSSFSTSQSAAEPAAPPPPPQRWISDIQARIGRCLCFGCSPGQVERAARVLRAVATEWRHLLAGSEGFLTGGDEQHHVGGRKGPGRPGLIGHRIAWGDMDSFGHVNNVNYFRYAESARVNWISDFAVHVDPKHRKQWTELMTTRSSGLIMRTLKCEYKFPLVYPDIISVYHKLRFSPNSGGDSDFTTAISPAHDPAAFILDCIIVSHKHRRIAARLEEDIVVYDYAAGRKAAALPSFVSDVFRATWAQQQRETSRSRAQIWDLIREVEALEKETWDRQDAVEDMGSAVKTT
ncbi:hypothetical protein VTK73DRAFT_5342 [Phialemonium thermophilum]|uniref:Thioesterase/thiol ester dehydrase-isomerase n=1 Tax=Phialemonium thermophilum TaxID=223376 RepID=A0ABR3Y7C9_9PEZI